MISNEDSSVSLRLCLKSWACCHDVLPSPPLSCAVTVNSEELFRHWKDCVLPSESLNHQRKNQQISSHCAIVCVWIYLAYLQKTPLSSCLIARASWLGPNWTFGCWPWLRRTWHLILLTQCQISSWFVRQRSLRFERYMPTGRNMAVLRKNKAG